jgi:hypothetical protein
MEIVSWTSSRRWGAMGVMEVMGVMGVMGVVGVMGVMGVIRVMMGVTGTMGDMGVITIDSSALLVAPRQVEGMGVTRPHRHALPFRFRPVFGNPASNYLHQSTRNARKRSQHQESDYHFDPLRYL